MKLQSLRVNQFKMFMEPRCINGVSDGLNVIAGPNEIGKSTMFDALRAVLFETYSASSQRIETLRNDRSRGAPLIGLDFEHDDGNYALTKRFLGQASVRLACPDGVVLEGPEAEERLHTLLRFSQAPRGGASAESMGTWDVLWLRQGDSILQPNLPNSARATLSDIVQSAAVDLIGGKQGRELLRAFTELHDKLHTPTHRPKTGGEFKKSIDRADELKARLEGLKSLRDQAEQDLGGLNTTEDALRQSDAGNPDLADQIVLEQLRHAKDVLTGLENRELKLNEAKRKQNERSAAQSALQQESERLQSDKETLAGHQEELEAEQKQINLQEAAAVLALEKNLMDAEAAQSRMENAGNEVTSILAADEALERIQNAESKLSAVEAQLGAVTTRIIFEIEGARQHDIQVDGRPLTNVLDDETQPLEFVNPLEIAITDMGRILIDPNVANRDELFQARRQAIEELSDALETAGADSVEDARQKNRQRHEHAERERDAQSELDKLAPDGVEVLKSQVAEQRDQLTDIPAEVWSQASEMAPDNDGLTQLKVREGALRVSVAGLETTVYTREKNVRNLTEELRQAELNESQEQLARDVEDAVQEVTRVEASLGDFRDQRPEVTTEQLTAEIEQRESQLRRRQEQRNEFNNKIAAFRALVDRDETAGIHEQVENAENELDQATREVARLEHEIAVFDLLIETLTTAENDAKDQYLEPVLQKVLPYIQRLFASAEISIDNTLNVTTVTRNPSYQEPFVNLSLGTQEQIAVIVRLALAKLLAEQGVPAVVVLDDALIYSDDDRMRLMFDILIEAARDVQILVFTCREQLFEGLNAHRLNITPCDHEGHSVA